MVRKILGKNSPGDSNHFASDDWDQVNQYLSNIDQSATDPVEIATNTTFRDNRLRLWNPAMDHTVRIRTLGFGEDYDLTIPDIDSDDDFLLLLHGQQFQNKIINLSNGNVLKTTDIQLGDILKSDGTGYVRVPLGTAGQVWSVNDTGTDAEWKTITIESEGGEGSFIPDDNSVTTAKIVDSAVTAVKLAGSITGDKLVNDIITTAKIANSQVTDAKLAGSISGSKLLSGAIGTTQLADGGVTNAKLAGSITQDKLSQITDTTKLPSSLQYGWDQVRQGAYTVSKNDGGQGIWNGVISTVGTHTNHATTSTNFRARWTTGSSSGNQAGIRTNVHFTKPQFASPIALEGRIEWPASQINWFMFVGLVDKIDAFPTGSHSTWSSGVANIGIYITEPAASTVRIAANDGTSTGFNSVASPSTNVADGGAHTFKITFDEGSSQWNVIWNGTSNLFTAGVSDVPPVNTNLAMMAYIETSAAAAKNFDIDRLQTVCEPR